MRRVVIILILLSVTTKMNAQKLIYDLGFALNFDNREYSYNPSRSETIFGARLSPVVGVEVDNHQLFASPFVTTDFGSQKYDYSLAFWYRFTKNKFRISAGIFPFSESKEYWSPAFISEKELWYRPNINGILFAFTDKRYNYELGVDWRGFYGTDTETREEFVIFSAGHQDFNNYLSFGYNVYMHHYANSPTIRNVSDNILIEPYLNLDLNQNDRFQKFDLKLGFLTSLQRDRSFGLEFEKAAKIEFQSVIQKWNFKIDNRLFYGGNLQPIISQVGFYFSDPFHSLTKLYDRLEIAYCPKLGKHIELNMSFILHFADKLIGNQAKIGLKFNLNE